MASSYGSHSNMIQFPRLASVPQTWDTTADEPLHFPARPQNLHNVRKLKQSKSAESLTQRKDRVEFLRRREWTRRVASGGDQPLSIPKRARTYSWEDIIAAADADANAWDHYTPQHAGFARRPDTIDEIDESDEPYVIYTATPRPPAPSAYTPHVSGDVLYSTASPSHSPAPSPTHSPLPSTSPVRDLSPPTLTIGMGNPYASRRGWRGPHSRHSSLSSISEEDEVLARF